MIPKTSQESSFAHAVTGEDSQHTPAVESDDDVEMVMLSPRLLSPTPTARSKASSSKRSQSQNASPTKPKATPTKSNDISVVVSRYEQLMARLRQRGEEIDGEADCPTYITISSDDEEAAEHGEEDGEDDDDDDPDTSESDGRHEEDEYTDRDSD
jgi:hypothetical protein